MAKHILHVFSSLDMGGAESRILDVAREIDRQKYAFDFLTMKEEPQYFDDEIAALGCKEIRIRQPRETGILKNFLSMYRIMKEGRYDVVHCHTSFHCGLACCAAWCAGVPIRIAHGRTTGSKNKSKLTGLFLSVGRFLIRVFSNVKLAISKESGKYLFGNCAFEVLPNAIDCSKYREVKEEEVAILRNELSIPRGNYVIGMVGRFEAMKNHRFALEWFSDFHKKHANSTLVLVGDGFMRQDMEKLAQKNNISEHVRFTGVRSDIPLFMKLFSVLIVPSIFEGLGGTILEAQAAGTPVVKSDSFTDEATMDLGLVEKVSLDAGSDSWTNAVEKSLNIRRPGYDQIEQAFDSRGYSIQAEIRRLCEIYSK